MRNKQSIIMKNNVLIIMTLLLIGVAFWVLNYLTPEYYDDYFYKYMFTGITHYDINMPITSIKDVLISQYYHYFYFNGRTIVHLIVQIFTGLLGKDIFNIVNSFVFIIFIYIINRLYTKITPLNLFFSFSVILLLYPSFKETALWMTGSVNYMWTSTFICIYLYIINKYKNEKICTKYIIWSIPCILIGWTHEGITFPLSVSIIIYIIFNHKNIYKQAVFPLMIGFIIGVLLCAFSPATIKKASIQNSAEISDFIVRCVSGVFFCVVNLKAFNTLICTILILLIIKEKPWSWVKYFYKQNMIMCNAVFISFGLIFCLGCQYIRAATGIELFSIIIFFSVIKNYILQKIKVVICIISSVLYSIILYYSIENYQEYKFILSQINNKKSGIILINEAYPPFYIETYILPYIEDHRKDIPFFRSCYNDIENINIATTFDCDSLAFVPKTIYNDIINNSDRINDIHKQKAYSIYVIPINGKMEDNITPVSYILAPTDFQQIPFYIRPMAHKMLRYTASEIPVARYGVISINGQKYLFVGKNAMIDNRVESISLK